MDNSSDFDDKVREATALVCNVVGIPEPQENERKFLVASVGDIPVKNVTVDITQHYLVSDPMPTGRHPGEQRSVEERVRKRGREGSFVYTHTIKRRHGPGSAAELDRMVTPAEHLMALERRDMTCAPIKKSRTCFVWEGRYWELDRYATWTPVNGGHLTVLEVEVESLDESIELPPFLKIEREVTGERAFANKEIAHSLLGYGWNIEDGAELVGGGMKWADLFERVRREKEVHLLLPNREEADKVAAKMHEFVEDSAEEVSADGVAPRTLGLPYALTLRHVPGH